MRLNWEDMVPVTFLVVDHGPWDVDPIGTLTVRGRFSKRRTPEVEEGVDILPQPGILGDCLTL